ncbi:unnamed protein product [Darwinula stevensoni]|uniref:Splicing factor 3B subunit 6 n=1 Tax=Darwinula stevensoni TaxID=69355 RepID=A0A7R9AC60_9CRUS|nr:unnamed protein product [Darwinula stevensoni]CAG0899704.1 unnamed protein product [Darwinula stevensoni]
MQNELAQQPGVVPWMESDDDDGDADDSSDNDPEGESYYVPLPQSVNCVTENERAIRSFHSDEEIDAESSRVDEISMNGVSPVSPPTATERSLPLDNVQEAAIRDAMQFVRLPESSFPQWAFAVPEEEWKSALLASIHQRHCHPQTKSALVREECPVRLPPEVNRVLYVRNLPYKITGEEMYDIFGKYGAIRQIRVGNTPETRGTAFVVYEDIFDAKNACDHLSGFNVCGRYLVVLYYQANKAFKRIDSDKKKEELDAMKAKFNLNSERSEK